MLSTGSRRSPLASRRFCSSRYQRSCGASCKRGPPVLEIDGSYGEGGGQLVRIAVALSALTSTPVRIENVRAKRKAPGLAAQHVTAIRAVAKMCDARVAGVEVASPAVTFEPGALHGGK